MNKDWLIIDSHAHYIPEEAVLKTKTIGNFDYNALIHGSMSTSYDKFRDIDGLLRMMDDAGINMAVLNQSAWSEQGLEMCKALNDGYARIGREYPGKFILCGHIPMEKGQEPIVEIERCIKELDFKAISIPSSTQDTALDSPLMWPIYEKISQLNVPIVVHPPVRYPLWGGGIKYNLRRTISREYDIAKGMVEVMYGVLKDFPDLNFLMPHYGGGIPGLKARLRAWYEPEGWAVPSEIKNHPKTPKELDELGLSTAFDELFSKLYFDMAGAGAGWIPAIKVALLMIRTDRMCFGTDYYPDIHTAEDVKTFIDNIKQFDIPEQDKRLILGKNIKTLFNI